VNLSQNSKKTSHTINDTGDTVSKAISNGHSYFKSSYTTVVKHSVKGSD